MPSCRQPAEPRLTLTVFPSELGWMALLTADGAVRQLTFGHPSAAAAKKALGRQASKAAAGKENDALVRRLRAYACGAADNFADVPVAPGPLSSFQRRILARCRKIPFGQTMSYAGLAAKGGFPGTARAVGNCMARNRIPLIVPCHRVVCSDGRLGSYSAPGGARTKSRLLAMESGKLA